MLTNTVFFFLSFFYKHRVFHFLRGYMKVTHYNDQFSGKLCNFLPLFIIFYESRLCAYESGCFFCQEIFLFLFFFSFNFGHVANFLIVLNTRKLNNVGFFCLFVFWLCCIACRILVPGPGIEPGPSALGAWSPCHWTTRQVWDLQLLRVRY